MHVQWGEPFFDGGAHVVSYSIHYTVREVVITVTARGVVMESQKKFNHQSLVTSAVIRNLPADTDIINVFITATNKSGLISEKGNLQQKVVRTLQCSRHTLLVKEINNVKKTKDKHFESSLLTVFFLTI
jgi:hypothetical protein